MGVRYHSELVATRMLWSTRARKVQDTPVGAVLRNRTSSAGPLCTMPRIPESANAHLLRLWSSRVRNGGSTPRQSSNLDASALPVRTTTSGTLGDEQGYRREEDKRVTRKSENLSMSTRYHQLRATERRDASPCPAHSKAQPPPPNNAPNGQPTQDTNHTRNKRAVNKEPTIQETDR